MLNDVKHLRSRGARSRDSESLYYRSGRQFAAVGSPVDHASLVAKLQSIVGPEGVFSRAADLLVYEYDGSVEGVGETAAPSAVALPTTAAQVAEIVVLAREAGLPVVA